MSVQVFFSTVANGNMYNRKDVTDETVIANRRTFLEAHGQTLENTVRLTCTYQDEETSYQRYLSLDDIPSGSGMTGEGIPADALVTTKPGAVLFLPVADCIGSVIYDPSHHVLMMAHLGRHSLEQDGAVSSIHYLTEHFGCDPGELKVWMSAAAGKQNYPIWKLDNKGMKEVAFEQFFRSGISAENIVDDPSDTTTDVSYYSYSEFLKGNRPVDGDHCVIAWMDES
jgi:polyphenol oxidase